MRVEIEQRDGDVQIRLQPEADDLTTVPRAARGWYGGPRRSRGRHLMRLVRRRVVFRLPPGPSIDRLHSDVQALACAFLVLPFIGRRLVVRRPVSRAFAEVFEEVTSIRVGPVDDALEPARAPAEGRPGLAFSGGIESTAAAILLPDPVLVHHRRARTSPLQWRGYQPWSPTHADASLRACAAMTERGYEVHVVASDLEYLTAPTGRAHQAIATPVLLLSASLGLDAVAVGPTLGATFGIGHGAFVDAGHQWHNLTRLYEAAGLSYLTPVSGLTEIGTTRIVIDAGLQATASSCGRGSVIPCRACVKCLRKGLVTAMLTGDTDPDIELDHVLASPTVIRALTQRPIHLESIYAWACSKYTGNLAAMRALCAVVGGHETGWNERFFALAMNRIPARYRRVLEARITAHVQPMTGTEIGLVRAWAARSADPSTRRLTRELRRVLTRDRRRRLWVGLRLRLGRLWRRARRIE
jgi:uncharacterized protein DUF6395